MTGKPEPILFRWNGQVMEPFNPSKAAAQYEVGGRYRLSVFEDRSTESHNHEFAFLHEAFKNLPEEIAAEVPSAEHLRKWSLVKAGFCDKRSIVCDTEADAQRFAAFLKPLDDYAIVTISSCVVTQYVAKSQSRKAMGKDEFQRSKQAILDIVAGIIGVTPDELQKNAGHAA